MLDPFHSPTINQAGIDDLLFEASKSDDPSIAPGTYHTVQNLMLTYHPLRFYRALRIAAMHAALTTDSTKTYDYEHASLTAAVLDPRNSDIMSSTHEPSEDDIIPRLLVRAVLASIVELGTPKPADVFAPGRGNPLSTPASAEMFQNLTSAWSGEVDTSWGDPAMHPSNLTTVDFLDLSGKAQEFEHTTLLPVLIPTDRLNFMHPNRAFYQTNDQYHDYPAIPLAWTWDPAVAINPHDDISAAADEHSPRTQAERHTYASTYSPLNQHRLIAQAKKYGVGYKPKGDPGDVPERVPEWRYAIIETRAYYGPGYLPAHDMTHWTPLTATYAGTGQFKLSASLRQARVLCRLKQGVRLPTESLDSTWWGADAANYALWSGLTKEEAVKFSGDLSCGTAQTEMVPYLRTGDTVTSPLDALCIKAKAMFPGAMPAYGQFAALQSGMRYLAVALMNRHFSAVTGMHWPEAGELQKPPSVAAMRDVAILYGHKNRQLRQGPDRRADMPVLERRSQWPAPIGVSNLRLFFNDYISGPDISLARSVIAPGALSTVENMLRSALEGEHGEIVKAWVTKIFDQISVMAALQTQFIQEEIEVMKARHPQMLRTTLSEQRKANERAHMRGEPVIQYPLPMALQDVATKRTYLQAAAACTPDDLLRALDARAAAIRAGTPTLLRTLDNVMPERPLTKEEKQAREARARDRRRQAMIGR